MPMSLRSMILLVALLCCATSKIIDRTGPRNASHRAGPLCSLRFARPLKRTASGQTRAVTDRFPRPRATKQLTLSKGPWLG